MATDTTTETRTTPMYASYATFVTFLDWVADMPVTPSQIDRSLWGSKFSGSGGAQLIAGLRFLGLLDGDRPTARLEALVRADKDNRKRLIEELLATAYGEDTVANLKAMTPKMLDDALRGLGTTDATHQKAVSFFVNAAKGTDIVLPMAIQKRARIRTPSTARRGNGATPRRRGNGGTESDAPPPPPPSTTESASIGSLRTKYIEMLMDRAAKAEEPPPDLLDRIENLLGFDDPVEG